MPVSYPVVMVTILQTNLYDVLGLPMAHCVIVLMAGVYVISVNVRWVCIVEWSGVLWCHMMYSQSDYEGDACEDQCTCGEDDCGGWVIIWHDCALSYCHLHIGPSQGECVCTDTISQPRCECKEGFTGQNCDCSTDMSNCTNEVRM